MQVARDLHDGVLQSLTGVRLKLQEIATNAETDAPSETRDRLLAIERAVAVEQRELRRFIDGLKPAPVPSAADGTLASRLDEVRERLAGQWKIPVALRVLMITRCSRRRTPGPSACANGPRRLAAA